MNFSFPFITGVYFSLISISKLEAEIHACTHRILFPCNPFPSPPFILLKFCLCCQQWLSSCPFVEWIFCR